MHETTSPRNLYVALLGTLLAVSVLLMILGTALLALRFRSRLRWIIGLAAGIFISSAVFLDLGGRTALWIVALLYFVPQLPLLLVGERPVDGQTSDPDPNRAV